MAGKAARIQARLMRDGDRAQIFYEETFAAFGYKYNAVPFRALAEAVPLAVLPRDPDAAFTSLSCAAEMTVAPENPWRLANVRPVNAPVRRLAAAAALFAEGPELQSRLDELDLSTRSDRKAAMDILCSSRLLGKKRAAALIANGIVPFALAEGRLKRIPEHLPPEDLNRIVRQTAFRLFGRDHNPALYGGNGVLIQGLLHINHTLCLAAKPDCGTCPLANEKEDERQCSCLTG